MGQAGFAGKCPDKEDLFITVIRTQVSPICGSPTLCDLEVFHWNSGQQGKEAWEGMREKIEGLKEQEQVDTWFTFHQHFIDQFSHMPQTHYKGGWEM